MHSCHISRIIQIMALLTIPLLACSRSVTPTPWIVPDQPTIQITQEPVVTEPQAQIDQVSGSGQAAVQTVSPEPVQNQPEPATITPVPTSIPVFSVSNASQDLPANIMEEIMYFGGMGGGAYECPEDATGGLSFPFENTIYIFERVFQSSIISCGWGEDEVVTSIMTSPNGREITSTDSAYSDGSVFFTPYFMIDDPLGTYRLRQEGQSGAIDTTFEVAAPDEPLILRRDDELILYSFLPDETIHIYAYLENDSGVRRFAGWQEYQVDSAGKLAIQLEDSRATDFVYYVYGSQSGDIYGFITCSHGIASRLKPGMQAQVISPDGLSFGSELSEVFWSENKLPLGEVVEIIAGPGCVDGINTTWLARTQNGQIGYLMENDLDEYLTSPDIDPSLIAAAVSCPGAQATRLSAGMHARVTFTNGLALRVRDDPDYSANIRRQIPEGTEMDIIDGPRCADQVYWWKIETADGKRGWVAEGDDGEYYVEPWQ